MIVIGLIGLIYLLLTFSLAGGDTLGAKESQDILQLVIALLILVCAILVANLYRQRNKKFTALGIILASLLVSILATVNYLGHNIYHTKFDKEIWTQSKWKPEKMSKTLVREKTLIGMTRMQVKEMLGEGSEESADESKRGSISYLVENNWTLMVFFQNDKVVETKLRQPYLGV